MEVAQRPVARPPACGLDFHESMAHFKNMFPTMDLEIIESVLRSNNGSVDATVDQLLDMSSCDESSSELTSSDCTATSSTLESSNPYDDDEDEVLGATASPEASFQINVIPPTPPQNQSVRAKPISPQQPMSYGPDTHTYYQGDEDDMWETSSETERKEEYHYHAPPRPRPVHQHGYSGEKFHLPQIPEDEVQEVPAIPAKPENYRRPENWMDASITDLVKMGSSEKGKEGSGTMDTLTVDQEENLFVTPTNLTIQEVIPDTPIAKDPRHVDSAEIGQRRGRSMSVPSFSHSHLSPVSLYRKYRPAMLGKLPDDFLRLSVSNKAAERTDSGDTKPKENPHPRYHRRSTSEQSHVFRHRVTSLGSHGAGHHLRTRSSRAEPQVNSWLSERLAENARMRVETAAAGNTAQLQLLRDEYIALLLQNDEYLAMNEVLRDDEFLQELRRDEEFMSTLSRDTSTRHVEETNDDAASHNKPRSDVTDFTKVASMPEFDAPMPRPEMQGYDDKTDSMSQMYLDRPAPAYDVTPDPGPDDVIPHDAGGACGEERKANWELRQQLSNMGAASKKKFMAIARRFFLRRRTPKPLYTQGTTPSTMNLLEEEEIPADSRIQENAEDIAKVPSVTQRSSSPPRDPVRERDAICNDQQNMQHNDVIC